MNAVQTDKDRIEAVLAEEGLELHRFAWKAEGEVYREGSSDPWRSVEEEGVIEASVPQTALIKLVTGFGQGTTLDNTPEWLFDPERPITVTLTPLDVEGDE